MLTFIPYDSETKTSTAHIQTRDELLISLGAPQVIPRNLDEFALPEMAERFNNDIHEAGAKWLSSPAVATKKTARKNLTEIAGVIFLADPLDERSKETMHFMREKRHSR